jgi:hypothetical protein
MKKILLIDDRTSRQFVACNKASIDLSNYHDILENSIDEKYQVCFEELKSNKFEIKEYAAIITHKSAFGEDNPDILFTIESLCKKHSIPLIFFSGGISVNYYEKNEEFEKLELNSKVLYSNNLRLFLEHYKNFGEIELMILGYGNSWKINILLNILEKINIFLAKESKEDELYEEFSNKTDFHLLKKVTQDIEPFIENGWISKEAIEGIKDEIEKILQNRILYER